MAKFKSSAWHALLWLSLPLLALASLSLGAGAVGWSDSVDWMLNTSTDTHTNLVLSELRLPRLLKALALGAALAASGVLLQAVTHNPLAEPGLMGVNSGAALGVALGIALFGGQSPAAQIGWALSGALLGSLLVLLLARAGNAQTSPLRLVLAGLALTATCHSLTAWLALVSTANLDQFRFWMLGSLSHPHAGLLWPGLIIIVGGLLAAVVLVRPLSALALGDDLARALGQGPAPVRTAAVLVVALLSGTCVALAGPMPFLGLIATYSARALAGAVLAKQCAYSIWLGAVLMLLADISARLLLAPFEMPVSAVLAAIGAPLLIWIVHRNAALALMPAGTEA
ncbi:FecCD family ABC transporter permease [Methylomonas albis]|uniref:Iron ABC transporter permease n=1 Tax=Methylomonas albis TaxID=1854563 RepID=A0ABR9D2J7_9GAMM|nr:iron ABC transporter permease [Methylomonas albis]MBD9356122.1 iron ABC transporter permease [Methylomonas albis]